MIPGAGDTHPSVSPAYPCRWKPGVFRQKRSGRPYRTSGLSPLHVMASCRSVTRAGCGQPCPVLPPPTHQVGVELDFFYRLLFMLPGWGCRKQETY
ncbi:hypothetical protein NPIL_702651 [Nephila pilipes]|uniref:Uncharacterized protein n=1 Tax=Nephila pilipes TaxID=299642 RepID=A0A8X6MVY7_NEPPI|nr:hypothetical protein NPIL_702651 [Nephila pilipes]